MVSFNAPTSKDSVRPADLNGHLVAIEVHKFKAALDTAFGPKDAVEITVHDIDDEYTYADVLWFATVLVSSLKSNVGCVVLARIGQGMGRPGQQPPWVLKDATGDPDAVKKAESYLRSME